MGWALDVCKWRGVHGGHWMGVHGRHWMCVHRGIGWKALDMCACLAFVRSSPTSWTIVSVKRQQNTFTALYAGCCLMGELPGLSLFIPNLSGLFIVHFNATKQCGRGHKQQNRATKPDHFVLSNLHAVLERCFL